MQNTIGNSIEILLEQKPDTLIQAKVSKNLSTLIKDDAQKLGLTLSGWIRIAVFNQLKK